MRSKKSIYAAERDTREIRLRRQEHLRHLGTIAPEQLVHLDESGVSTQMARTRGRPLRGRRVVETVPRGHWETLTILSALTTAASAPPRP